MSAKKNESWLNQFIGRRSISKTLQFELRPIGETLANIEKIGFLQKDEKRNKDFAKLKKLIDKYHKHFIEEALDGCQIDWTPLKNGYDRKREATEEKDPFEEEAAKARKTIAEIFANANKDIYGKLFRKELITELLPKFLENNDVTGEEKELVENFRKFTTYLIGFQENRKNIYTDEKEVTAIGYRLVHENFPKFVGNMGVFREIQSKAPQIIKDAEKNLAKDLKEKGITSLGRVFTLDYFSRTMPQQGIDFYNLILGGRSGKAGSVKTQGLNELVNLYNQKHAKEKIPRFRPLYKQILSDSDTFSFRPEPFENDAEVIEAVQKFCSEGLKIGKADSPLLELAAIMNRLCEYDAAKLKIKKNDLSKISQELLKGWNRLLEIRQDACEKERERETCRNKKFFSVDELNRALAKQKQSLFNTEECADVSDIFPFWNLEQDLKQIEETHAKLSTVLADPPKQLKEAAIEKIKNFLDAVNGFFHKVEILGGSEDESFLGDIEESSAKLREIVPLYNKVRNYVTRKPADKLEKYKLTFENPQLAGGWDKNKETDYCAVLFLKDRNYYLGIINPADKVNFSKVKTCGKSSDTWQKVSYKLLPSPFRMLPKVFFSKTGKEFYKPSERILKLYKEKTFKENLKQCHELIDFYKDSIKKNEDWKIFDFHFRPTKDYESLDEFYGDVEEQGYRITFDSISDNVLMKLVGEKKLFLFQIYNKDFSPRSTGTPNLHTLYWKMAFADENLKDTVIRLCGRSELFYRKGSGEKTFTHKKGSVLVNRQTADGTTIPSEIHKELFDHFNKRTPKASLSDGARSWLSKAVTREAKFDIVKDRRFTEPKFKFHVPLEINCKKSDKYRTINEDVLQALRAPGQKFTVLGIDRGERNLIYITLIDQNGKILLQKSLNQVEHTRTDGTTTRYDYQAKLDQREKERDKNRKSWKAIGTIKELKEGYISQIVHEIAKLIVENKSVIVMEDLNFGFKRGRFHVEKQVYQKFEKALLEKLNYLVFKTLAPEENGSVLKGYQLTAKFESFQKLQNQSGIIFYVPAAYTSKIDPTTGFTNPLYGLHYESVEKAGKRIQEEIQSIRFNKREDHFEFVIPDRREKGKTPVTWTVCTAGNLRWSGHRNTATGKWDIEARDVTKELKALFKKHGISFESGEELKEPVLGQDKKEFFNTLFYLLNLTLQLRYSNPDPEIEEQNRDFILSPVRNRAGKFFDSRTADESLPKDADANGAYHIALKGLFHIESGKSKIEKKGFDQRWLEERRQNLK